MGRNNADFHGITYNLYGTHPTSHELEAYSPEVGDVIGYMRWHKDTGRVEDISVNREHRRKGVATGMWNHAVSLGTSGETSSPKHSPVRTPEGTAWAKSLDEHDPK